MATNTASASDATCTYCSKIFTDPRMLDCLHSFCKECLVKYSDKQGSESSLKCPDCNIATLLVDNGRIDLLPKDLRGSYEADIAQYEIKVTSKKEIECDRCVDPENGLAVSFCCDECEFLCKVCTKDHKTWRKTLHHELISLSGKKKKFDILKSIPHAPMTCNAHLDSNLTYFCESHRILLCRDCVLLEHKECKYQMIKTAADGERSDLRSHLESVQGIHKTLEDSIGKGEKMMQQVQAKHKSVDDFIMSTFEALMKVLTEQRDTLLKDSGDIALGKLTALQIQNEELKEFRDNIAAASKHVTAAIEVYTPAEMLSTKTTMTTRLQYLLKLFKETNLEPCKSDIMPTSLDSSALHQDIKTFGGVIAGCSPSMTTATIEIIPKAVRGCERKFVIKTHDVKGKRYCDGGEPIYATIRLMGSSESPIVVAVTDNNDGTYNASFTPTNTGEHVLSVVISNDHIRGSPFIVYVREPRDYRKLDSIVQTINTSRGVYGVAVDNQANVYATLNNHSIAVFDSAGTKHEADIGTPGSNSTDDGKFYSPTGILLKGDMMYVTEQSNHRIQKLTTSGEFVAKFGTNGSDRGQLNDPRGICMSPEGKLFVAEFGNNRVSVFNSDGSFDSHITGQGSEGGEMKRPWGITMDPAGYIHVTNYDEYAVKIYSQEGDYISKYTEKLSNYPSGICIDEEGYSFVAIYNGSGRVEVFDPEHKHIKTISGLCSPYFLALDKDSSLYVAEYSNSRVQKY